MGQRRRGDRGGTVVDGTGAPGPARRRGDHRRRHHRIGDRLDGDARARRRAARWSRRGSSTFTPTTTPRCSGIPRSRRRAGTASRSVVAGNCGFSIAPVRPEHRELLVRTLQHVEDMAPDTLFEGVPWDDFETFPQYLDAIEQRGTLLNYACYVGHTAVRIFVMGEAGYERAATDDEIRAMQRVIADALAAGAAGFATSSSPTHSGDARPPGAVTRRRPRRGARAHGADARRRQGRRRAAARREGHARRRVRRCNSAARPSGHVDRAAHGQGLPVAREDHGSQHRGARRGHRGVAAGVVPAAHVPDEPARAVHVQHAARRSRS